MLGLDELTWTEQWWAACRQAMEPNSCCCCCCCTPTPAPLYILQQNGSHEHEIMREEISYEAESACSATLSSEGEAHSAHEIPKVWYSSLQAHGNNIGFKKLHLHIWSLNAPIGYQQLQMSAWFQENLMLLPRNSIAVVQSCLADPKSCAALSCEEDEEERDDNGDEDRGGGNRQQKYRVHIMKAWLLVPGWMKHSTANLIHQHASLRQFGIKRNPTLPLSMPNCIHEWMKSMDQWINEWIINHGWMDGS